jgi:hypothetical protein
VFFAASEADKNWYERLYIVGDDHFSAEGNQLVFRELAAALTNADALLDRGFGSASSRQVCPAPTSLFGLSRKRKGSSRFRPRFLEAGG